MLDHQSLEAYVPAVLGEWGLVPYATSPVAGGTLNFNFDIHTSGGRFFLRCYRSNLETERILGEHDLTQWIANRGIPAPPPIETPSGTALLTLADQRWALFGSIQGGTVERGLLSPDQAFALGAAHGRIQATLATHPQSAGAGLSQRWDRTQSLEHLDRLVSLARARGVEQWITDGIERQRRLLDSLDVSPPEHFSALPCQLLHGDFHDQQVIFDGDRVAAVVDWEIWHPDPRAWEVVRSLAFSRLLDSPRLEDYLAAYREHVQLSEGEIQLALTLWFQSRVVGLWAWWAYLVDGNSRVKQFFPEMLADLGRVTDERWTASVRDRVVRAACG